MPFRISERTLEQLEWPQLVERLRAHTRTARGRARCEPQPEAGLAQLLEPDLEGVRPRLAETGEARAILDAGEAPPLGGAGDLAAPLRRASKGGVLAARELAAVAEALSALTATRRFLEHRQERAPRLAAAAGRIADLRDVEEEIGYAIDRDGEVRDAASPALARARRAVRDLGAGLQRRLAAYLRDPGVVAALSDTYYTLRNDRYVLPVRADARGRVRGIVHDASSSGTTVFIEPEAVVDLNNRLKSAEIEIERETLRVLRRLTQHVVEELDAIEEGLSTLAEIDLAFARGRLSRDMQGVEPEVGTQGVLDLRQLRHPLLPPGEAVPNDVQVGAGHTVLVLSGPNAGGKTVTMKAVALAVLCVRAGLHVPADPGSRVDAMHALLADIGDEQSLRESLSTFSAHMAGLARIVDGASRHSLVVLDEIGDGTDPGEGAALAQAVLESLADAGARVIATTHYNLLKEMAAVDPRFANASFEFDAETLAPTYRLRPNVPGASSATAVAARMGLRGSVLERANALLEREDRHLDQLLAELSASRIALDTERREAQRLHAESKAARDEYRRKLERVQERRDRLFQSLRDDLERSFRDAHAEVADVIRDLQRRGTARDAARARERLLALREQAPSAESLPVAPEAAPQAPPGAREQPVDWRSVRPGDPVRVRGGGEAALLALPDRRGRAAVRIGSARVVLEASRLAAADGQGGGSPSRRPRAKAPAPPRVRVDAAAGAATRDPERGLGTELGQARCALRGLRVDEALDRVVFALDRAAAQGRGRVIFVHGGGTGALRDAVRAHLAESPYVASFRPGEPSEGGNGVTVAMLER